MQVFQNKLYCLVIFLSVAVALYALLAYSLLPAGSTVHPEMKKTYELHPVGIYTHIIGSVIALLIGPFLLSEVLRKKYTTYHKIGGKIYLIIGVLIGGLGGLYMSFYAFGGIVSTLGFGALAILWIYTGLMGLSAIKRGDYISHRVWMIRNFSLTFAAVTIRIYLGIFSASGLEFEVFYPILSWLCWVPNLFIVQWLILPKLKHI